MLAEHMDTEELCAIKIFKPILLIEDLISILEKEVSYMRNLDHPNIVRFIDSSEGASYVNRYGDETTVVYIASELCTNGNIFEWVANTGAFSEKLARYYFHQMISGLEYLHNQGMSHRDLKLENILIDHEFKLKIADFGFASVKASNETRKGTHGYMAPEVEIGVKYNG